MDFQQSKTFINLQSAFEGELISSSKYEIYGIRARQDDYQQIAYAFDVISRYEREHAVIWLKLLNNGEIPNTLQNLIESSEDEANKGNNIYREYAQTAREEGYNSIGALFDGVANIELNNEVIFRTFAEDIENNQVFCKPQEVLWVCINCGNIMGGLCAPAICPICGFPQGYYQVYDISY
ncbi:rubrerythrin family protein [Anaerocolumna sp. MB42-C2]|uniref:rubrerythrin family protein n=1 Tax=Anaerocolumna sp. MB42-C2 TaxID=3070997 RepID=UPI0027E0271A|nr:rubrerythrin family protein [Anaerocolumna sp. MB42-C2]WMJ89618.1 rubrerythrin family protein [Anaerocolumna sp. MB42-C2]